MLAVTPRVRSSEAKEEVRCTSCALLQPRATPSKASRTRFRAAKEQSPPHPAAQMLSHHCQIQSGTEASLYKQLCSLDGASLRTPGVVVKLPTQRVWKDEIKNINDALAEGPSRDPAVRMTAQEGHFKGAAQGGAH